LNIYFLIIFAFMAMFFLSIGFKVLASKKPLLLPSKTFFMFMVFAFSPQLIMSLENISMVEGEFGLIFYISPLAFVVLLAFFWVQMKGYTAIGISDGSFRNALHHALNQNHIQFEEQLSLIKLTESNAELQVSMQGWAGIAQITLKQSKDKNLLAKLVISIDEYFTSNSIEPQKTASIFYVLLGLFMLAFSGFFYVQLWW